MRCDLRRRKFLTLLGSGTAASAIVWPFASRAQQSKMPVVGFLRSSTAHGSAHLVAAFLLGLKEGGFVEGRNVAVEYRWANDQTDRLPELAAQLVQRPVDVLFAGASGAALAAKAATSKIPIVFVCAIDPVKSGLVSNLSHPRGNATGVTYLTSVLGGKRLELLRALVPAAKSIAVLGNPRNPTTGPLVRDIRSGANALGLQISLRTSVVNAISKALSRRLRSSGPARSSSAPIRFLPRKPIGSLRWPRVTRCLQSIQRENSAWPVD